MRSCQPSQAYLSANDLESLDSPLITNHNFILDISSQPDFYIFTSLLWVRHPNQNYDHLHRIEEPVKTPLEGVEFIYLVPDDSQPDLGLLRFHHERLATAAEAFQWKYIRALEKTDYGLSMLRSSIVYYIRCLPMLAPDRIERRKVRLMINKAGVILVDSTVIDSSLASRHSCSPTFFIPTSFDLESLDKANLKPNDGFGQSRKLALVYLDTQPTQASSFTTHKTSYRLQYNTARARANVTPSAPTENEVLLYNVNAEVMEASLCTVYFFRDNRWITPAAICGGNLGVTRRLALERDLCVQGTIEIGDLKDSERIWLSNGARGFFVGRICLGRRNSATILRREVTL